MKKGLEGISGSASIPTCVRPCRTLRERLGAVGASLESLSRENRRDFLGGQWRWERPGDEEEPAWKRASEMVVGESWAKEQEVGPSSLTPHIPHAAARVALKHKGDHLLLGQEPPRGIPYPWGGLSLGPVTRGPSLAYPPPQRPPAHVPVPCLPAFAQGLLVRPRPGQLLLGLLPCLWVLPSQRQSPRARTAAVTIVLFSGVLGVCWNVPLSPSLSC